MAAQGLDERIERYAELAVRVCANVSEGQLVFVRGADVTHASSNLARRDALRSELEAVDADTYLVEIKAAAIDVVAEAALERGLEVVFADNELVPVGVLDLDTELIRLADQAIARDAVA